MSDTKNLKPGAICEVTYYVEGEKYVGGRWFTDANGVAITPMVTMAGDEQG